MPVPPAPLDLRLRMQFRLHRHWPGNTVLSGHHNLNRLVALRPALAEVVAATAGDQVLIRTPRNIERFDPRAWAEEAELLAALQHHLPDTPRRLARCGRHALHSYVPGRSLAADEPTREHVETVWLPQLARLLGDFAEVPLDALPALPPDWPESGSSTAFLQHLSDFFENRVRLPGLPRYGRLFADLGIPEDAVSRFHTRAEDLTPRPFVLLHGDLHRANLVRRPDGRIVAVDWEIALVGDPLQDLAAHLIRMDYDPAQRQRMVELWQKEMCDRGRAELTDGLSDDLGTYLDFEYANSLHPDIARSLHGLPLFPGRREYAAAARSVHRALERAREPLRLDRLPGPTETEEAVRRWRRSVRARLGR